MFTDTSTVPSRDLRFGPFTAPLTNAGGTVATVPDAFGNTECLNCSPFRTLTATLTSVASDLTVNSTHAGIFLRGGTAAYTITVNNIQAGGPSIGTVTATDVLPAGLTATAINGTGWACTLATLTCTRNDTLDGSASYPPITLSVSVGAGTASNVNNTVTVSGGSESNVSNDTGTDATQVNDPPDLVVAKTHIGTFNQGGIQIQVIPQYMITVTNTGLGPTLSPVTVVDNLPAGLTAIGISGPGWNCTMATLTCTRTDSLNPGSSYPVINITVNVAGNAPPVLINSVTVSGGSELNTSNDTATDATGITQVPDMTIAKSHIASLTRGQTGAYTLVVSNVGPGATFSAVTVTESIPTGLTITSMAGAGWACNPAMATCTRSDVLAVNASYPPITVGVSVAATAPLNIVNQASVSGGPELNLANDIASDPTVVNAALTINTQVPSATSGGGYLQTLSATGGVPPYTWSATGQPSWLTISSNGTLTGSPPRDFYGSVPLTVTIMDSIGGVTTTAVQLSVQLPPLQISNSSFTATSGSPFAGSVGGTGGLPPFTWSDGGLPSWLTISSEGVLTGTPPLYGSAGSYTLPIIVTDSANNSTSLGLALTVNPAPITVTPSSLAPATEGMVYSVSFSASGGTGKFTWSGSSLPSGFGVTPGGVLSGSAPQGSAGTYTFTISATDSASANAVVTLTLQVKPPPVVITTLTTLTPATETAAYTATLAATGGVPPYQWTAVGSPAWLQVSSTGSLSGTPPVGTAGNVSFTATATDASMLSASATFRLMISSANTLLGIDTDGSRRPPRLACRITRRLPFMAGSRLIVGAMRA